MLFALSIDTRIMCDMNGNNVGGSKFVLLAYEVIWLSMAKEYGAGRDEANPQ